jgi:transposase
MGRRTSSRKATQRMLSERDVDVLLTKLRAPSKHDLTDEDKSRLLGIVETWAHLIELAASKSTSIRQVRHVLGLSSSSRKTSSDTEPDAVHGQETALAESGEPAEGEASNERPDEDESRTGQSQLNRDAHGRRSAGAFGGLEEAYHPHTSLHAGDRCPACTGGRVYKYQPSEFTSVSGRSPLVATRHTVESLQCGMCKEVFRAPLPARYEDDGVYGRTLYTYSAVAMVSVYRYFAGLPMHRQQTMQKALGVEIPDASIWDMCERMADALRPIHRALHDLAKDAKLFFGDDTGATILDTRAKLKKNRKTKANTLRTGCHTTGVIAVLRDSVSIVLFVTGIHHTGEVMDLVLDERDLTLEPPIFMGDCISSNTVTKSPVRYAGCNAHAVRRFKALAERYPEQTDYVLERYGKIYDNEDTCVADGVSAEARRDYHREHSRPLLQEICDYGEDLFERKTIEPNSDLGQALNYVIGNEHRLSAFTRHLHAPLDNNRVERELRTSVRLRETGRFFRNAIGSSVADTVLSVGATALTQKENLLDYFVAVQRHAEDVRARTHDWLPWSYRARVEALARNAHQNATGPPQLSSA